MRRQLCFGQRLEPVWPTLRPEENNQLRALLGPAIEDDVRLSGYPDYMSDRVSARSG